MSRRRFVIHSEDEIAGIRRASQAAATVLHDLAARVTPGMTTLAIDRLAGDLIARSGGTSAFFGYRGYPGQICISINDEVVHGIGRADRIVGPGDLVSLDVGVELDGFIGDNATTVCAGTEPTGEPAALMRVTRASLKAGVAAAKGGGFVNDIGKAVERVVHRANFSVVRDFVGHGCGCELHEPPEVPNFSQHRRGPKLRPGMVLAIEPMVNVGTEKVIVESDGWTVRTRDGQLSAHFEHMVLITKNEAEILTWPKTV